MAVGDKYLDRGWFSDALEAYEAAGILKDKLISIGDEYLKKGLRGKALKAYEAAIDE